MSLFGGAPRRSSPAPPPADDVWVDDGTPEVPPATPDTLPRHWVALVGAALILTAVPFRVLPAAVGLVLAGAAFGVALLGGGVRRWAARAARLAARHPALTGATTAAAVILKVLGPVVALATAGVSSVAILLLARHQRSAPSGDPTDPVKSSPEERFAAHVEDRWPLAAARAGWTHPDQPDLLLPIAVPPTPNGVGGVVVEVDPLVIDADPEQLRTGATAARRALHAAFLFLEPAGGGRIDSARIHLYEGYPLAGVIPWSWARDHGRRRAGEWVPVGPTATGQPAWVRPRLSTILGGVTDAGKGGVQLAVVRGLVDAQVPTALLLVDNKGARGGRELERLAPVAAGYVQASADAWPLVRAALDVMAHRYADVLADGEKLTPDDDQPLVHLIITELWNLLQSRPPAHCTTDCPASTDTSVDDVRGRPRCSCDWAAYTGGRFTNRPPVGEWRAMLDEALTLIAREGQAAAVSWSGGLQAAQMDAFGKGSRLRTVTPQRILLRVLTDDDVEPIIGTTTVRPPAELIPEDQPGTGYLRQGTANPVMFRAMHIAPRDIDRALVRPLRSLGAQDWAQHVIPFILDGTTRAA